MRNESFEPHRFIDEIAARSRSDIRVPNPDQGIGRNAYAFSKEEDRIFEYAELEIRGILQALEEGREYRIDTDPIGNLFVTLFGSDRSLMPFMMHSHLDSVYEGGKYDGVAGVACAIDVLDAIIRSGKTPKRGFRIGVYRSEESSPRNGVGCLGSAIATGTISKEQLDSVQHTAGNSLRSIFTNERWAHITDSLRMPNIHPGNTAASLEVHVEQSSVIAKSDREIGIVVDGIGGATRLRTQIDLKVNVSSSPTPCCSLVRLEFRGAADHSGGTPPNPSFGAADTIYRRDALVGSCFMLSHLLRIFPVGLIRSEPKEGEGYTSIPAYQVAALVVTRSCVAGVLADIERLAERIQSLFGVETAWRVEQSPLNRFETVDPKKVRQYLNIPLAVSVLSTKALRRQASMLGTTRATVADFTLSAGALSFKLDLREVNPEDLVPLQSRIERHIENALGRGVLELVSKKSSQPIDAALAQRLRRIADGLKVSFVEMPSLPGHDSDRHAQAGIPVAMLFIRQNDGVSHSPYERMERAHFDAAARVSRQFALEMLSS